MKAIVLSSPGNPTALQIQEIAKPLPRSGWVLIKVKAFGLNCYTDFGQPKSPIQDVRTTNFSLTS